MEKPQDAVQHGHHSQQGRQGPRTWVVVALTLGVVVVVILAFVGGLVTGIAMSDTAGPGGGGATGPGAGSAGRDSGVPAPGSPAGGTAPQGGGAVDSCVVGTWRTVEHSESADTEDGKVTMTGIDRTVTVTADGTETVTYGPKPATVTTEQGSGTATYAGTVVYDIVAQDGTMSFGLRSVSGTLTIDTENGTPRKQDLKPGTGSVTYTCTADRLTQEATGFRAVLQRAS